MHSTKDFINRNARIMILFLSFNSFLLTMMAYFGVLKSGSAFGGIYIDLFIHSVVAYIIMRNADVRSDTFGPCIMFHLCNSAMMITLVVVCVLSGLGHVIPQDVALIGGMPGVVCAVVVAGPAMAAKLACERKVRAFVAAQNATDPAKQSTTIEL